MRALVVAIHGIDSSNESSFVDDFKTFCATADLNIEVLTHEYFAGPFPLFNNWIKDPALARKLYRIILNTKGTRPVVLLAHSNGTVIALRIAKMLAAFGVRVGGLILVAGAVEGEIRRNGVLELFKKGCLRQAIAYCSTKDEVVRGDPRVDKAWYRKSWDWIWGRLMWPYGSLGVTGWLYRNDQMIASDIITRWYECSHSGYFEGTLKPLVFSQILRDIHACA